MAMQIRPTDLNQAPTITVTVRGKAFDIPSGRARDTFATLPGMEWSDNTALAWIKLTQSATEERVTSVRDALKAHLDAHGVKMPDKPPAYAPYDPNHPPQAAKEGE